MAISDTYRRHAAPEAISALIDIHYVRMAKIESEILELQVFLAERLEEKENGTWPEPMGGP